MDNKEIKERCLTYFNYFSKKNLNGIDSMFSKDVTLRDWEINEKGKSNVVLANKRIFDSVDTINVEPIEIFVDGNIAIAELKITVNSSKVDLVIDIIEFDEDRKISQIRAYKG